MMTSPDHSALVFERPSLKIAGSSTAVLVPAGPRITAAEPVAFGLCAGRYMPALSTAPARATAVLFAAPWGLEELSTRKFFRVIADRLSAVGIASLRFDYPGTGDSLDPASYGDGLACWRNSLLEAAAWLKARRFRNIMVVGQGLGASLALQSMPQIAGLAGTALLAPVLSGRGYLRELSVWSKVVDDSLNLKVEDRHPAGVTAIAGLVMPAEIATEIGQMKLAAPETPTSVPCLLLERPGQLGADAFAEALTASAFAVERHPFEGYEALIPGPINARIPENVVARLISWVEARAMGLCDTVTLASFAPPAVAKLQATTFVETGVRFGGSNRLAGVLCQPVRATNKPVVLFFGSAYDRHAGWGRLTTLTARRLAAEGITSLRFDCANVGDSPPEPTAPAQVLYSPTQETDARAALDFLDAVAPKMPILAVGRCSGAYLAFRTALGDERLNGMVLVNPYCFVWDEDHPLQDDLRAMPQSLATYRRKLLNPATVLRVLRGEIDLAGSARNVAAVLLRKIEGRLISSTGLSFLRAAERKAVRSAFEALDARQVPIDLLYSRGDVGTDHLQYHFGQDGRGMARYPHVRLTFLEETDHNLTPRASRRLYTETIIGMVDRLMSARLQNRANT